MNHICAVVVTYNRKVLLLQCIEALLSQSLPVDIMVIDNASTDGTKETLAQWIKTGKIYYDNTGSNLGGAGGFHYGIRKAMASSYDYLWIMDDDTIAKPDAVENLYRTACDLKNEFGFLNSVVFFNEAELCAMNRPGISDQWYSMKQYQNMQKGLINIKYASFVSLFIRTAVVKRVGLPIKEFFIWNDDYEYTTRISKLYDNYLVCDSIVEHRMKVNQTTNILTEPAERIERYFYNYRNGFYVAKRDGKKAVVKYLLMTLEQMGRVLFHKTEKRWKKCWVILKGTVAGIAFSPKVEFAKKD